MKNSDNCGMILFPDFARLKAEVEKLRTEMSMLLLERDELVYVECKNIETAYMLALGNLEYKAYKLHCDVLRLKRKIELIQAKKNRQEKIIISAIEAELDEEFAEYRAQLDEQINRINDALERSKSEILTDAETRELKKLYRTIVKALHPDLHPELSDAQKELFYNAVTAYENGDLNSLRIIGEMVSAPEPTDCREDGMGALIKEKERLTGLLKTLRNRIAEIKSEYPYNVKEIVQDEEKIAEKRAELEEVIAQLSEILEIYKHRAEEMMR